MPGGAFNALIGALRVEASLDTGKYVEGAKRLKTATKDAENGIGGLKLAFAGLKTGVAGLAAGLSVGLFTSLIKNALEYAGSLAEVAQQIGVTSKDLQTFRFAAGQVGVSQEQLEKGLTKLTITLGQVAAGAEKPTKALQAIGISADELKGKDTGEAFRLIADGLEKVTDRSQRAAIEVALFGKSGAALDNLLSGGSTALNNLTDAAERLGIVLSEDQIARADETADKLEALKTVLSASIANVVADNADAILGLANSLVTLVGTIGGALRAYQAFVAGVTVAEGKLKALDPTNSAAGQAEGRLQVAVGESQLRDLANQRAGGASMADRAAALRRRLGLGGATSTPSGADIDKFLAPNAPKAKKARADHTAEDQLRDQFQFGQQLDRAQMDVLRAQQDLAKDYVERTSIGIKILNAENASFAAEQAYNVELYKITNGKQGYSAAQAAQLKALHDQTDSLQRQKLLQDEQEQRQRDVAELDQHDLARRKDILQSQEELATTASERRKIALQLLDIDYQAKKQALQNILDTSKDEAAREDARRDLLNLNATFANDKAGVIKSTRNPLEEWAASIPKTTTEINEALQSIEANSLEDAANAAGDLTKKLIGTSGAVADLAGDMAVLLAKMLIFKLLSGILPGFSGSNSPGINIGGGTSSFFSANPLGGGVPKLAGGGSLKILGRGGTDNNLLSLNGLPVAQVNRGERIDIANDHVNDAGGIVFNQTFAPQFAGNAATREDLQRMAILTKAATLQAVNENRRRGRRG